MSPDEANLSLDIEKVKKIPIVDTMLEVICRSTGMGFAAIARVTQDRWIACSVRDEIQFGLQSGGELKIETTICNEIRDSGKPVIIDHVADDEAYSNHHTPIMYGFQSYISIPIFLKNNEFFGTLCAIDPKPAEINNLKTIGMFNLFAELIAFHLNSIEVMEKSNRTIQNLNHQLAESVDENRQYKHISNHNLQEPLRKIRLFSSMLVNVTEKKDTEKMKTIAWKINSNAQKFSMMIKDLSEFSNLNYNHTSFESVNLNTIIEDVLAQLKTELTEKKAIVKVEALPTIKAIPLQMEQLFFHLIGNAIKYAKKEGVLKIQIDAQVPNPSEISHSLTSEKKIKDVEIRIEDNGIGIEKSQLENIFNIFSRLHYDHVPEGSGIGLAYCRKITRNHGGSIKARSEINKGTTISVFLPTV